MDRLTQEEAELSISNAPGQNDLVSRLTPVLVLWLGGAAVCAGVLIAAGVFYLLTDMPGLFPGDPPVADLFLELALLFWPFILTGVAGTFVLSRFLAPDSGLRTGGRAVAALLAISILALVPVMARVGERHFGEWRQLNSLLRRSESKVLELVQRQGGRLSEQEFALARTWFQDHPVQFKFEGLAQPVHIRMMRADPPYVGVAFGQGHNAAFDLDTMICTYAD